MGLQSHGQTGTGPPRPRAAHGVRRSSTRVASSVSSIAPVVRVRLMSSKSSNTESMAILHSPRAVSRARAAQWRTDCESQTSDASDGCGTASTVDSAEDGGANGVAEGPAMSPTTRWSGPSKGRPAILTDTQMTLTRSCVKSKGRYYEYSEINLPPTTFLRNEKNRVKKETVAREAAVGLCLLPKADYLPDSSVSPASMPPPPLGWSGRRRQACHSAQRAAWDSSAPRNPCLSL